MSQDNVVAQPRRGSVRSDAVVNGVEVGDDADADDAAGGADTSTSQQLVYVQVEAFGSGVVLHRNLAVGLDGRCVVADLRRLVVAAVTLPPATRAVRLFVGHGGTELHDDLVLSALASELEDKPLVVFPALCTSCRVWWRKITPRTYLPT